LPGSDQQLLLLDDCSSRSMPIAKGMNISSTSLKAPDDGS